MPHRVALRKTHIVIALYHYNFSILFSEHQPKTSSKAINEPKFNQNRREKNIFNTNNKHFLFKK